MSYLLTSGSQCVHMDVKQIKLINKNSEQWKESGSETQKSNKFKNNANIYHQLPIHIIW